MLAGTLSVLSFDFFFVPPYYTFVVLDQTYLFTFGVMFVVALSMTHFTGRIREQAEEARERERQAISLYELTRELAVVDLVRDQVPIAERHLARAAHGVTTIYLLQANDSSASPSWPGPDPADIDVRMAASWAIEHGEPAGWATTHGADAEALAVPLRTPTRVVGVAVIRPERPEDGLPDSLLRTIEALGEQAAIAIERTSRIEHQL